MSDDGRSFSHEVCGADAAPYALGALAPAEAEAFERHVKECHLCAEDLAGFEDIADRLARSAPQYQAPPGLRRRVMANVHSKALPKRESRPRLRSAPIALLSGAAAPRKALTTAMIVGLASTVVAISTFVSGGSSEVRVLATRVVDSRGTAQVRLADGQAELSVRHFPAPATGHIYEVWLKRPGRAPEPTTVLFSVNARGAGDVGVPITLRGAGEILVTEEPAGGSVTATHQPVIVGRLS